jgi:hypothetical protein
MRQRLGHRVSGIDFAQRVHQTVYFLREIIQASRDVAKHAGGNSGQAPMGAFFDAQPKMEILSKPFLKVLRGARLSRIWSNEPKFFPLQAVGSKATGVLNHKFKEGLPQAAMVDIKGDPLNPLYLCSHTIADKNAMLFYSSLLTIAQRCGSCMTPPPPKPDGFSMAAIQSDAHFEMKGDQMTWARLWCTEASVIDKGKLKNVMYFNSEGLNAAIRDTRDKWGKHGLAIGLLSITNARLNYKKTHSLHLPREKKCQLLAAARQEIFTAVVADPPKYNHPSGWLVPCKPFEDTTITLRSLDPGAPVLEGHLQDNTCPDHTSPLFR